MKKSNIFILLLLVAGSTFAQKYPRGILDGEDEGYKNIAQKAPPVPIWFSVCFRPLVHKSFLPIIELFLSSCLHKPITQKD